MDLVGGYYDAGDHVKFGQPMAFAVTMLSWAAVDFNKDIIAANQMGHTLWAIRWGTDYFIKAHTRPNVLWAQVNILSQLSNIHEELFLCKIVSRCDDLKKKSLYTNNCIS